MAVKKINGFAAPYRSATFQQQADAQVGRSGILSMAGRVSGTSTITIPPFSFIQNGLISKLDTQTLVVAPSVPPPYHLVVTAPTPNQTEDLIFAFTRTPHDLTSTDVIVASFDGVEWHQPVPVSVDGLLHAENDAHIAFGDVGPSLGLQTSLVASNWVNSPGALFDTEGQRQVFQLPASFPQVADDADFQRVDKIVFRRPLDSPARIGVREFLLGGTFAATPSETHARTGFFDSSTPRAGTKVAVGPDNSAHVFAASGYGGAYQLTYAKLSSDRATTLVAATTLLSMTDTVFDVAPDASGNLHVVFTNNAQIFYQKFSPVGASLVSAVRIDTGSTPCKKPTIIIDPQQTKVFIGFQSLVGPANSQLYFATVNLNGATITAAFKLFATATNLENIALAVSPDLTVFAAWEDTTFARIYTRSFDDIGTALSAAQLVSGATTRIGFGTLVDGAQAPLIAVSETRGVFITFLQNKGGGLYGLSVWNDGAAFMQTLLASGEAFTGYSFDHDLTTNGVHLLLARAASVDYVKLEGQTVLFTLNLGASPASSLATERDALGSMFHAWTETGSAGFANYQSSAHLIAIGAVSLAGSVGPVTLSQSQFLLRTSQFSGRTPAAGDQVTITGSAISGNNATKNVTAVQRVSQNAVNDSFVITVDVPFIASESPAPNTISAYAAPTGNQLDCAKSTSELMTLAYRLDTLPSDILITRMGSPGTHILNWLRNDRAALDSDSFLVHGSHISVDYGKTLAGAITITGGLKILDMIHNIDFGLVDGSYAVPEGSALFVALDPANQSPTPQVLPVAFIPWASPIQVLGIVKETTFNPSILMASAGLGALDVGEADIIGEDLPITTRQRLGIIDDVSYQAYPSTLVVAANDTYPQAIGKLDAQVGALEANRPLEDTFAGDGFTAQPTFTTMEAGLSWSTDNTVVDIQVWVDGRRQEPFTSLGTFTSGFRKIGIRTLQLSNVVNATSIVTVRKEGTAYGGPVPPSPGKLWSDQVDHAILPPDLAFSVGSAAQRFNTGYFGTVASSQMSVVLPFATASQVKVKTNGDVATIAAGRIVSISSDGQMHPFTGTAAGKMAAGVLMETTLAGSPGRVLLAGYNIPGALTGLGFAPGDEVYVDETGSYSSGVIGLGSANDTYQRVGWADCATATVATVATDLIMVFQTIAEAP